MLIAEQAIHPIGKMHLSYGQSSEFSLGEGFREARLPKPSIMTAVTIGSSLPRLFVSVTNGSEATIAPVQAPAIAVVLLDYHFE